MRFLVSLILIGVLILTSVEALGAGGSISPWRAVARSAILPGWGQFATGGKLKGIFSFVASFGLVTASWIAWREYKEIYDNDYAPAVLSGSPDADYHYDRANQRYKLSRGLAFTAVGIWAYSMVDSYVSAILRNAELRAGELSFNTERIDRFDLEFKLLEEGAELKVKAGF